MLRFPRPQSVTGQAGERVGTGARGLRLPMAPGRHSGGLSPTITSVPAACWVLPASGLGLPSPPSHAAQLGELQVGLQGRPPVQTEPGF